MIKLFGNLIGACLGSVVSPSWLLMNVALKDYFNLSQAFQSPQALLLETLRFQAVVEAHPEIVILQLFPILIGLIIVSSLFVSACSYLGGQLITHLLGQRLNTASSH